MALGRWGFGADIMALGRWGFGAGVCLAVVSLYSSAPGGRAMLLDRTRVPTHGVEEGGMKAMRAEMRSANADLRQAQAEMHDLVHGTKLASLRARGRGTTRSRQQMLMGIGGWGSGEESDNAGDWEVAMRVDKGCEETLKLRHEGNTGWKRKKQNKCDPNKIQNPMMWPYDKPGEEWHQSSLGVSSDTGKEPEKFPYDTSALHDNVWDAEETPDRADGIWHGEGFRRSFNAEE